MPRRCCSDADLAAHLDAQLRVEIGERLVHEAHRRLGDDGATERDALLLAARELRGLAVEQLAEAQEIGGALQARSSLVGGHTAHLQPEHDVLGHRKVRKEGVGLKHHRHPTLGR